MAHSFSFVPLAILGASLLGSGHCVAMCGGLVAATTRSRREVLLYQLGRLGGYLFLGGLAGFLGSQLLDSTSLKNVSWISALLMGAFLVSLGFRVGSGKGLHLSILPSQWTQRLFTISRGSVFMVGALTALLPCGWLHVFVLGALATQSAVHGAGFLFFFWLGSVPAMSLAPWALKRFLKPFMLRSPRLSAGVLVLAGVACLCLKLGPLALYEYRSLSGNAPTEPLHVCHDVSPDFKVAK